MRQHNHIFTSDEDIATMETTNQEMMIKQRHMIRCCTRSPPHILNSDSDRTDIPDFRHTWLHTSITFTSGLCIRWIFFLLESLPIQLDSHSNSFQAWRYRRNSLMQQQDRSQKVLPHLHLPMGLVWPGVPFGQHPLVHISRSTSLVFCFLKSSLSLCPTTRTPTLSSFLDNWSSYIVRIFRLLSIVVLSCSSIACRD